MVDFIPFQKIPRWSNQHIVITEKIDGTNAQIFINEDCTEFRCGSRSRWITPDDDNYGFARWCHDNSEAILSLGKGQHFGEWYGSGIQRGYGLSGGHKRFVLFNTLRWGTDEQRARLASTPIGIVPILYQGEFAVKPIDDCMQDLLIKGSQAEPGYMNPEGIVIYLPGSRSLFKLTYDNIHKWESEHAKEVQLAA